MTMKMENVLCNKPIAPALSHKILDRLRSGEEILFVLVGDLHLNAIYGDTALVVTDRRMICVDDTLPGGDICFDMGSLPVIEVRRLYGNAVLNADGQTVLRFSFGVVALMEAAAAFLNNVRDGHDPNG